MDKVQASLYRALWRYCRRFDKYPTARALIHRNNVIPERVSISRRGSQFDSTSSLIFYFDDILNLILNNKQLFLPSNTISFVDLLKQESRRGWDKDFQCDPTIEETSPNEDADDHDNRNSIDFPTRVTPIIKINVGFMFLKKLSAIWNFFQSFQSSPFAIDKSIANVLYKLHHDVAPGTILISHPLIPGPLHRSVILLLEHSEKSSYGLVLNHPTSYKLSDVVGNLPQEIVTKFGSNIVAFGGMVRRLQIIHKLPNCGGSPIPFCSTPTFAGGTLQKILTTVKKSPSEASNIHVFVGCCFWQAGQLESEIDAGYWMVAKSEPDKLLENLKKSHSNNNLRSEKSRNSHSDAVIQNASSIVEVESLVEESLEGSCSAKKYQSGGTESKRELDIYDIALKELGESYGETFGGIPSWVDATKFESFD